MVSLTLLQSFNWFKHQIKPRFAIYFFFISVYFLVLFLLLNNHCEWKCALLCILLKYIAKHLSHFLAQIRKNRLEWRHLLCCVVCNLLSTTFSVNSYYIWWNCHTPNCIRAHFVRCFPSDYHCEFVSITLLNHKNKIIFHCLDEVCHFRIKYHQRNFIYYNWIRCFYSIEMSFYVQ